MQVENLVLDALDPRRLGQFWRDALDLEVLTDEPDAYEARLPVAGGPPVDLCFPRVPERPAEPVRLHLDLRGGDAQPEVVERLLGLGAEHADIGQRDVPWVVLADPEGNAFCVLEDRLAYATTGPVAAVPFDSADPAADAAFWAWLTGWRPVATTAYPALQHPSGSGLLLEFCPEPQPKPAAKNRLHVDVRLEAGEEPDLVEEAVTARGGQRFDGGWGDLPWRTYRDPSGNEFCVLPARQEPGS